MLDRLKELEKIARELEPQSDVRAKITSEVNDYAFRFLDNIYSAKAYEETGSKGSGILDHPFTDEPLDISSALGLIEKEIDTPGLNPASGGHLGYVPGGGIYFSALGDFLADVMNRYAGVFYASPGAVRMENMLIRWMTELVGYPDTTEGNLASGGSIANLIAIVTARDAMGLRSKDYENAVVYMTSHVHHCIDKSLRIAGLMDCKIRYVDLDDNFRMKVDVLEDQIKKDTEAGLNPFLVIASAGTTDTGAMDPLEEIGTVAKANNCWYHIDGAYGAFFILCEEGRKLLKGMELSDSLVMDPHKGMFLPYGCGAVLIKDGKALMKSHYYQANYLLEALDDNEEVSPADLSPELTKHFRGLRLWLPMKLYGLKPFKACVEEKLWLCRYAWEELKKINKMEVGPFPDLSIVIYRYIPENGDANAFNKRLLEEIRNDGAVFISSTILNEELWLRFAILSFRTHKDTIDLALSKLKEKINILENTQVGIDQEN